MKLGLVVFDILSLLVIASLWGLSIWSGVYVYHYLCVSLWMPVALVIGCLAGVLTLIVQVGVLHRLLPRVRPGRYPMLKHPMFFIWVVRFILQRALFPPVLEVLLFQFNVLRFLSLRALGAKVSFGASMSSDVTVLDPWLLEVEDGDEHCWSVHAIDEHGLEGLASETACFRIETSDLPPTAPGFEAPTEGQISTLTPEFVVTNGVDPEGSATTHLFEVDLSPTFDSEALQAAEVESGADGQTSWSPELPLEEDAWVHVRVLCSDGANDSDWAQAEFFVSATNDPPNVPVLLNPADGVGLSEGQFLEATLSVDPEGEEVTHDLMVMNLRDQVMAEASAIETDSDVVSWDPGVFEDGHYQWTSRAVDAGGVASEWAQSRSFYVGNPDYADQPELDGVQDYSKTEGCSCSQGPARGQWAWWALGVLVLIQRRKRPRC